MWSVRYVECGVWSVWSMWRVRSVWSGERGVFGLQSAECVECGVCGVAGVFSLQSVVTGFVAVFYQCLLVLLPVQAVVWFGRPAAIWWWLV